MVSRVFTFLEFQVLFGLFGSPPEITFQFEESHGTFRRILVPTTNQLESIETCPIINDRHPLRGQLLIRLKSPLEHYGITLTLVGAIERTPPDEFITTRVQLAPAGCLTKEVTVLEFDFGNARFPFPSYDGVGVSVRYFLRAIVQRKLSDIVKESTLWCPVNYEPIEIAHSAFVEMDIGLEEFLHLKVRIDKSQYH